MKGRVIIETKTGAGASELAARLEKWMGDRGEGALYASNLRTSLREHAERVYWEKHGTLGELTAGDEPDKPGADKTYPAGMVPGIAGTRFAKTGEFRSPKAGEFYLSGAIPEVYPCYADLEDKFHIMRPIDPPGYVVPSECGKASEARAVGRRIADVLNALERVNKWVLEPCGVLKDCEEMSDSLKDKLRADGWRLSVTRGDKWQVLPPKDYLKS